MAKPERGDQGQATTQVRDPLDLARLAEWMIQQRELTSLLCHKSPSETASDLATRMQVRQFGFGQSNPTYLIRIQSRSNEIGVSMVLRKKPKKVAHASAHALHREFRVLKSLALHNQRHPNEQVPVPQVYAYCQAKEILGAEFYLMEYVAGRIFTDPSLPGFSVEERKSAYQDILSVLGNLHKVNYREIGLEDYGKRERYVERQLKRLTVVSRRQSQLSGEPVPEIEEIARQLGTYAKNCPDSIALLHGDFKIDNLVFHSTEPRIIAILDWELSTLGDPLCDLANLCMMYYIPKQSSVGIAGIAGIDYTSLGVPSRRELIRSYCESNTTTDFQLAWMWSGFYLAFLFFKNCVIVQGVAQRSKAGLASSAVAGEVAKLLPTVIHLAQSILRDHPPPVESRL